MPEKILVIEDDAFIGDIVAKHLLNHNNFHCDVADTIEKAKSFLENSHEYFAAIVDLGLPGHELGAGLALTTEYDIPSIVFTGNDDPDIYEQFSSSTLIDFVNKSGAASIRYISSLLERVYRNQFIRILVVDDSVSARNSLTALLRNHAFSVISAGSGDECFTMLSHEPDIVIIDQYLPDIMGYELCAKVRKENKNERCQIIGVSSKKDRKLSALFLKNFGNDFIYRPFDPEEFCNRINQRAELIDHIRELERLSDEKNKFLAMAAHDLRSPLNVIQLASNRMVKLLPTGDKLLKPLDIILNSIKSMQNLVGELLDIGAIESGQFELNKLALNLSEVVISSVDSYDDSANDKAIVLIKNVPDSLMAEVDPVRIKQVIDNLLSNAIKYSPHDRKVFISLEKQNKKITFTVEDQGPGIESHQLEQLFVAFKRLGHTTTGGESSHGLGLSICFKIIEAHNGRIKHQESESGGSKFYFELPLE